MVSAMWYVFHRNISQAMARTTFNGTGRIKEKNTKQKREVILILSIQTKC